MTVIRDIHINNFRGIKQLRWCPQPGINCLIGPGDGGKSTILDALELTLGSKRNVQFTDADFHMGHYAEPIIIDVTIGNLSADFLNLETYGHFLRGWDPATLNYADETSAVLETVLMLRLTVRDDLEPEWSLFAEGPSAEGRERNILWKHRQIIAPTRLGAMAAHHMALGPRSVLGKISSDTTDASRALVNATRQARQAFAEEGCQGIEDVLETAQRIANEMGISVAAVSALLDVRGATFSGGAIALHDVDQVPLKNLGSGSIRLLVAGLQKEVGQSSISIIDEVEFGLEPYRILRLLDALGAKGDDQTQQVFMTTHSPIVLRELSSNQLSVMRTEKVRRIEDGTDNQITLTTNSVVHLGSDEMAQKTLRVCAEAFLAPSVIVCEGKTEIGLIRGIDLFRQDAGKRSALSHGCHWADGGGSSMIERALLFARMGYRTSLFMDSDVAFAAETYASLTAAGVTVFRWPDTYSTEGIIFQSAAPQLFPALLGVACEWRSRDSVNAKIQHVSQGRYDLHTCETTFAEDMRAILGQCAGDGKWFKDIDPAETLSRTVLAPNWQLLSADFQTPINELWAWIQANPTNMGQ